MSRNIVDQGKTKFARPSPYIAAGECLGDLIARYELRYAPAKRG